ncbi:MAG TPA: prepilin-type N-terminal cleavage/methylation domain-containing protein [Candidatus Dojkabacteria bacterium]|jgi:prepilin-type N-terminal cleavage/methylation domain-containing protein
MTYSKNFLAIDKKRKKQGYTILELVLSMAIFGIIFVILNQVLFSAIRLSRENYIRALYRESVTEVMDFIKRDIRNANYVFVCDGNTCEVEHNQRIKWEPCNPPDISSICRYEQTATGGYDILKRSTKNVYIKSIDFERIPVTINSSNANLDNETIIVTIEAVPIGGAQDVPLAESGAIPIDIQQIAVSTRNITK